MQSQYVKSLFHALAVLQCFSPSETVLSGSTIARKIGIHKTTAYRILTTLAKDGFVEKVINSHGYRIGPMLYYLGNLYLGTTDLLKAARSVVVALNELTNETVLLSVLEKDSIIYVMKEESKHRLRLNPYIGQILPAYSTATGKALLSDLSEDEVDSLYPYEKFKKIAPQTVNTKKKLKLELERIRVNGIAISENESYEGVHGVASLIRNAKGKAIAAIAVAKPIVRMDKRTANNVNTLVKMSGDLISYNLGYNKTIPNIRSIEDIRSWWINVIR